MSPTIPLIIAGSSIKHSILHIGIPPTITRPLRLGVTLEYRLNPRGHPQAWVALNKHSNYPTEAMCDGIPLYPLHDNCGDPVEGNGTSERFPVLQITISVAGLRTISTIVRIASIIQPILMLEQNAFGLRQPSMDGKLRLVEQILQRIGMFLMSIYHNPDIELGIQ